MSIFGTVTTANGGARSTTTATTGTFATALTDLIAVYVGYSSSSTLSINDLAGNSYTALAAHTNGTFGQIGQWFYCLSATAANASNTFTATLTGSENNIIIWVYDVTMSGTPEFDILKQGDGSTGSFNTSGTDELTFCLGYNQTGSNFSGDTGYTLDSANFATFGGAEHQLYASAQTGVNLNFNSSVNNGVIVSAVSFMKFTAPVTSGGIQVIIFN